MLAHGGFQVCLGMLRVVAYGRNLVALHGLTGGGAGRRVACFCVLLRAGVAEFVAQPPLGPGEVRGVRDRQARELSHIAAFIRNPSPWGRL